ncbi:MAG TPA: hypothetical protein VK531_02855 [Gemmatimonadales bacterium]|nr:hypothetical protein [Gemmatimonadales bacterium]
MRRIQYLSGNAAGQLADVPDTEAENLIASGFAQDAPAPGFAPSPAPAVPEPTREPPAAQPAPAPEGDRQERSKDKRK